MDRTFLRRPSLAGPEEILDDLTTRQYLFPHCPVGRVLTAGAEDVGYCAGAAEQAAAWLQIDPAGAVGRLRRTQLAQLARCIHRFWRQARAEPQGQPESVPEAT